MIPELDKSITHAYYNTGYIQAIDDLVKKIISEAYIHNGFITMRVSYIKELSEQLKGGNHEDSRADKSRDKQT